MPTGLIGLAYTDPFAFLAALAKEGGLLRVRYDAVSARGGPPGVYYFEPTDSICGLNCDEDTGELTEYSVDCREYLQRLLSRAKTGFVDQIERELSSKRDEQEVQMLERLYGRKLSRIRSDAESAVEELGRDELVAVIDEAIMELYELCDVVLGRASDDRGITSDPTDQSGTPEAEEHRVSPISLADNDPRRKCSDDRAFWVLDRWEEMRLDDAYAKLTLTQKYNRLHQLYSEMYPESEWVPTQDTVREWVRKVEGRWK